MRTLSIQEARAQLGDLILAAQNGETVIITRYGKPAAVIAPIPEEADGPEPGPEP